MNRIIHITERVIVLTVTEWYEKELLLYNPTQNIEMVIIKYVSCAMLMPVRFINVQPFSNKGGYEV